MLAVMSTAVLANDLAPRFWTLPTPLLVRSMAVPAVAFAALVASFTFVPSAMM